MENRRMSPRGGTVHLGGRWALVLALLLTSAGGASRAQSIASDDGAVADPGRSKLTDEDATGQRPTPVKFIPHLPSERFQLQIGGRRLVAPGVALLPAGPAHVSVTGTASFDSDVEVPREPSVAVVFAGRADRLRTGRLLMGFGPLVSLAGVLAVYAVIVIPEPSGGNGPVGLLAAVGFGGLGALAGLGMLVAGIVYEVTGRPCIRFYPGDQTWDGPMLRSLSLGVVPLGGGGALAGLSMAF